MRRSFSSRDLAFKAEKMTRKAVNWEVSETSSRKRRRKKLISMANYPRR